VHENARISGKNTNAERGKQQMWYLKQ
jgi:hypothetical protein